MYAGLETIQEYACCTGTDACGETAPPCECGVTATGCGDGWPLAREFVWGDSSRFPEPVAMIDYTGVGLNVSNTCGTGATTQPAEACDSGTPTTGCVYHYLHDALGSVIGLTDCGGNLVERYTYDPYGKTYVEHWDPAASSGAGAWIPNGGAAISGGLGATTPAFSAFGNPFMWTGQRFDAALGLYHFRYRSFSPALGRWMQFDPAGYINGVNLYQYAFSNPLFWLDAFGLDVVVAELPWWVRATDYLFPAGAQNEADMVENVTLAADIIGVAADVATLGGTAVVKGVVKVGAKKVLKVVVEGAAEKAAKEGTEKVTKEAIGQATKEGAEKATKAAGENTAKAGGGAAAGPPAGKGGASNGGGISKSGPPDGGGTSNAGRQRGPTGKRETTEHWKYNEKTGQWERSEVEWDEFGRQIRRRDHTDHGWPDRHSNPHEHRTRYSEDYPEGLEEGPINLDDFIYYSQESCQ